MLAPVVAVKVLFGDFTDDERRRFLREARVAHQLRHENIVTVLDFGVARTAGLKLRDALDQIRALRAE